MLQLKLIFTTVGCDQVTLYFLFTTTPDEHNYQKYCSEIMNIYVCALMV